MPDLHNIDAEQNLLGSIFVDPSLLTMLDISPDDFFIRRHSEIWRSFERLSSGGVAIDLVSVSEDLNRRKKLSEVGGMAYLAELSMVVVWSQNAEDYARIVKDYARRRAWVDLATKMVNASHAIDKPLESSASELLDTLMRNVRVSGAATPLKEVVTDVFAEICERMQNPIDIWGLQTGFVDFDRITGGLHQGEILYLSGKPGIGKSIIAMQLALQLAQNGAPGAIYSLEMGAKQVVKRWLSYLTKVGSRDIKTGNVDGAEFSVLSNAIDQITELPVYMSDSPDWTSVSLRADLARLKAQFGIKWFVLDYAYLLKDMPRANETERTGYVSAQLKTIARALDLAGVVVHSLRKSDGILELDDLRGSGQVGYDTDLALVVIQDDTQQNLLHCRFLKGRELENSYMSFDLVKLPGLPAVANAVRQETELNRWNQRKDLQ